MKILYRETVDLGTMTFEGTIISAAEVEVRPNNKHTRKVVLMTYVLENEDGDRVNVCERRNSADAANLKAQYYTEGRKVKVTGQMANHYYPELSESFTNLYGYGVLVG